MAGAPVSTFNIFIKASFAGAFVLAFLLGVRRFRAMPMAYMAVVLFLSIYSVRLLYDSLILGLRLGQSPTYYVLSYFFLLTFLPILVLGFIFRKDDVVTFGRVLLAILLATCLVQTFYIFFGGQIAAEQIFTGRAEIAGELEGTALLGPIHFGITGASLAAYSLAHIVYVKQNMLRLCLNLSFVVIGVLNIVFSGSRGPLLGLIVTVLVLMVSFVLPRTARSKRSAWGGLMLLTLPFAAVYYVLTVETGSIYLIDRLFTFIEDRAAGVGEARDIIYYSAWQDFLEAPVLGRAFVDSINSHSPHNLPLEVLMSTGVIGGLFFLVAIFILFRSFARILVGRAGPQAAPIAVAAVPTFTLGLTSGAIPDGPTLWLMLAVVTLIGLRAVDVKGTNVQVFANQMQREPRHPNVAQQYFYRH